jgi:GxxExxY protein
MLTDPFGTNSLTNTLIGCAIRVHRFIGPGVYEKIYSECMEHELKEQGLNFELGRPVALVYRGTPLKAKYYIDIVVENLVIVELKAVAEVTEIHRRQLLTQLKLTDLPVGLLINFNVVTLKDGVKRLINPTLKRRETEPI